MISLFILDLYIAIEKCKQKLFLNDSASNFPLFSPNSYFIIIWHFVHIYVIIHNIIQLPLVYVFGHKVIDYSYAFKALIFDCNKSFNLSMLELVFFIIDICINCNLITLH